MITVYVECRKVLRLPGRDAVPALGAVSNNSLFRKKLREYGWCIRNVADNRGVSIPALTFNFTCKLRHEPGDGDPVVVAGGHNANFTPLACLAGRDVYMRVIRLRLDTFDIDYYMFEQHAVDGRVIWVACTAATNTVNVVDRLGLTENGAVLLGIAYHMSENDVDRVVEGLREVSVG